MPKVSAVGITLSGAIGIGVSQGFSITAAVAYANPNTTSLNEVLDEDKISWLSMEVISKISKHLIRSI